MEHKHFGYRILVVDDEQPVCEACHEALAIEGYMVDAVLDGEEALRTLKNNTYDIILLDLKMPGMSGLEVLEKARGIAPKADVVMMTGYATVESAVEAMKLGAIDYIKKPFTNRELSEKILQVLERKGPPT
jgi:two-component system, OmpR family, alkaline phosphatase synthesis response regulator PhoP